MATKFVSVFDVSQTTGEPLPEKPLPKRLQGEAPAGLWDQLSELVTDAGFTLHRADCSPANGVTDYAERTVTVRPDIDDAQAVKTLAHELGHVLLHEPGPDDDARSVASCRGRSESVAYLVTQAHGLDAGQYTFNYVATWAQEVAKAEPDLQIHEIVSATGARVIGAAHRILDHTQAPASIADQARTRALEAVEARANTPSDARTEDSRSHDLVAKAQALREWHPPAQQRPMHLDSAPPTVDAPRHTLS